MRRLDEVWVVYGRTRNGERVPLVACHERELALDYAEAATKPMWDDGRGDVGKSPAEVLELEITVAPLLVEPRRGEAKE